MIFQRIIHWCVWGSLFIIGVGCASSRNFGPKGGPTYSEKHINFEAWGRKSDCCAAKGKKIVISAGGDQSSRIGLAVFNKGGNIVDVAVATAFALGVERPQSAGIGGGGFLLLRLSKPEPQVVFVDFRETAPERATKNMFLDADGNVLAGFSQKGPFSVAVPGFVAGLYEIHKRWGKLSWSELIQPSIDLAGKGFKIYPSLGEYIEANEEKFQRLSSTEKLFFRGKKLLKTGQRFVQPDLAGTLRVIAQQGKNGFYQGIIAKSIAGIVRTYGGILEEKDLKDYQVKFREPLSWKWGEYTFFGAPPPSAGGFMMAQMFNVLRSFDVSKERESSGDWVHLLSENMKRSYADRSLYLGDPDFVKIPVGDLISLNYAEKIRKELDLSETTPSEEILPGELKKEQGGTTHLSILDNSGNAISSTLTINGPFGSGILVPQTGIFLNNEMDDFSIKDNVQNLYGLSGSGANSIAPGKRPVSSMSPTVVLKNDNPVLVVGGAGGSRIVSSVLQVVLNYLVVFPEDLKKAVFAPRMHHQWLPDQLELETGYAENTLQFLKGMGHQIVPPPYAARVHAVAALSGGELISVHDPRDEGGVSAK